MWSGVRRLARLWVGILLIPAFSSLLFFLSLQVLLFFLSFGKFVSAAQRGHPLGPPFFFPPSFFSLPCFASLHFSFSSLCFKFFSLKFQFCFVFSIQRTEHRERYMYMCTIEIIDREFVGCNCRITERKMGFLRSVYTTTYFDHTASQAIGTEMHAYTVGFFHAIELS